MNHKVLWLIPAIFYMALGCLYMIIGGLQGTVTVEPKGVFIAGLILFVAGIIIKTKAKLDK